MADVPETTSTLNGLFKEVYPEGIKDVIPSGVKLQKIIPYIEKAKEVGNQYHQPVILAYAQGYTHIAANGGLVTLNDAAAGTMKDAVITPSQVLLREQMTYEAAARSAKGRNAFMDGTALMFENMQKSIRKHLEVLLFHGNTDLGVVSSYSVPTITITAASYAPGIWSGVEGGTISVYQSDGTTLRNSDTIASVDIANRTVTLTTGVTSTTGGDRLFYKGGAAVEMYGLQAILANTGNLFGISASTYSLWKSTSYNANGTLTFDKTKAALAVAVGKGLDDDCDVLVNPKTWDNMMSDLASLRRFVEDKKGKGSSYVIGAENIEFYAQSGKIAIVPSIYVKEGFAYGITPENWLRIGASDVTFTTPGFGDQIFFHLPTANGFETRAYTDQALFGTAPGKNFLITGIVNV